MIGRSLVFLTALVHGSSEDKNYPVTRVVNLLKKMQETLEEEDKRDQEVYEKFECWCTTNDKAKTRAIEEAEEAITQLQANIEEYTATVSRLGTEIKNLEGEVEKYQRALSAATAIREKELKERNAEEKDLIQSITSLKAAIVVLSKHHKASLMATNLKDKTALENVVAVLHHQAARMNRILTPTQRHVVKAFLQAPGDFRSHASQSGEIFGILKNMKETFEANLSASQREEIENARLFEQMKAAKTAEIQASTEQIDSKNEKKATSFLALAEAKQNLEDTQNSLSADQKYLMDLKTRCALNDEQWTQRQKARQDEVVAVGKALAILANEDNRDLFSNVYNKPSSSFLQKSSGDARRRHQAVQLLHQLAVKTGRPEVAALETAAQLDAFTKVKHAIEDMITQLQKEKKDEIKHKDWCTESLFQNLKSTEHTQRNINDAEATIEGLEADIRVLDGELETLKKEIAEIKLQIARAGEDRDASNKEFRETINDQKQAVQVLGQAIKVLKAAFEKPQKQGVAELQTSAHSAGPPPPEGFQEYKKNQEANPVIALIQHIIYQSRALIKETQHDEQSSQNTYEKFVNESSRSIDAKDKSSINKEEVRAQKIQFKSEQKTLLEKENSDLAALKSEEIDVHKSCDFVLKNFDIRQEARDQEVEALRQAIAILSGSDFGGFLQKH